MIETRNYRSEEGYVLPYLSFSSYEALPYIRHMFTTREGGVSKDIYESLNLSFTRGMTRRQFWKTTEGWLRHWGRP